MPGAGLEPARACAQWCLRPSRLPASPPRQLFKSTARRASSSVDEGVENRHRLPPGNRDRVPPRASPTHSQDVAGTAEDVADVARIAGEQIPRVRASIHAVDEPAPIRVDEASKESFGTLLDDRRLPVGSDDCAWVRARVAGTDRPSVSSTRTPARIPASSRDPVDNHLLAQRPSPRRTPRSAADTAHRKDLQPKNSSRAPDDVTVAEVEAEKIRVGLLVETPPMTTWTHNASAPSRFRSRPRDGRRRQSRIAGRETPVTREIWQLFRPSPASQRTRATRAGSRSGATHGKHAVRHRHERVGSDVRYRFGPMAAPPRIVRSSAIRPADRSTR